MDESRSVHTMRNDGRHTSSLDCVCKPVAFKRCPEECTHGCYACVRGWTEISYTEAVATNEVLHVQHNDVK